MSDREYPNIYSEFREWLYRQFIYHKDTLYPVTYRQITKHFPQRDECSAEVLATLIEEMNCSEAVFTALEGGGIKPCYRNLRVRNDVNSCVYK